MKSIRLFVAVGTCIAAMIVVALPASAQCPEVPIGTSIVPSSPLESQPSVGTLPQVGTLLSYPGAWLMPALLAWSSSSRVPLSNRLPSAVVREPQRGSLRSSWGSWARVVKR